jgi:hypothetical protein
MPRKKGAGALEKRLFPKVSIAREMLKERAEEILADFIETAKAAREAGEFEAAGDMYWKLIEHMPADTPEERIVDTSVDKQPKQLDKGPTGPTINIGLALGGLPQQKKLAPAKTVEVVEAKVVKNE